jgi:hypothetical protein
MRIGETLGKWVVAASFAALASAGSADGQAGSPATARDFGTSHLSYAQVPGLAFFPIESTVSASATGPSQVLRIPTVGSPGDSFGFSAPVSLPSGALVKYLELDACDDSGGLEPVDGFLVETDSLGNVTKTTATVSTDGSSCKVFSEDVSATGIVVDNKTKHYFLHSDISFTINLHVGLAGMVVGYQLQVSPAPVTATFGDVPTSYIYFRAIEALAASGITGGCGNGNFCPSQPVTRGEIAKFLANALGLYWQ